MDTKCSFCAYKWEATRLDPYILRCGFCGKLTCERCGRHKYALIHVCPVCYRKKGDDLEDIFVGTCGSCGWIRPVGAVGAGVYDKRNTCQYCRDKGSPEQNPENEAAYTKENFQHRVRNYFKHRIKDYFPPVYKTDPGTDLLPLTAEKFENWDRTIEFEKRELGMAQAAFHKDAASVEGLLKFYEMDRYKLKEIAFVLGRINEPEGNKFLLGHVNNLRAEPYYAMLAIVGLSESPGKTSLEAVLWLIDQEHSSITPVVGLELLLKMEFLQPGFLFQPEVIRDVQASLESINNSRVPQHLAYFLKALDQVLSE